VKGVGAGSEGERGIPVVNPDQEQDKEDHKYKELQETTPFFAVVHFIHSLAKKRQFSRLSNTGTHVCCPSLGKDQSNLVLSLRQNQPASFNEPEDFCVIERLTRSDIFWLCNTYHRFRSAQARS
jgi:hypothetical protein